MLNQIDVKRIEQGTEKIGKDLSIARRHLDMLAWDGTERRKHPRYKVRWSGILESTSDESRERVPVRLSDISEGGCCVHVDRSSWGGSKMPELGLQERFELTLFLDDMAPKFLVEVRWYIPTCEAMYGAGLEFVSMARRSRSILEAALRRLSG
ncbi:MAG: PilZ domain-containing protein [Deltaproteobacteria bacterium]|nr:PilZ domain-containing protein [Deltaproteobacteria bacterium]